MAQNGSAGWCIGGVWGLVESGYVADRGGSGGNSFMGGATGDDGGSMMPRAARDGLGGRGFARGTSENGTQMSGGPKANVASVNGWNAEYLEAQYAAWEADPGSVSPDLGQFFEGFRLGQTMSAGGGAVGAAGGMSGGAKAVEDRAQSAVTSLIQHYRELGHLCAAIDPFGREREMPASLTPQYHGLGEADLDATFDTDHLCADDKPLRLSEIIGWLDETAGRWAWRSSTSSMTSSGSG